MMVKSYWSELSDEQLMRILASGHSEPLGELYIRHSAMVKDAMMRFCPEISIAEAEEMVQDVFLVLNRKASKYREQMKFKAWVYGIAVKTVSSWRRTYWLRRKLLDRHDNKHIGIAVRNTRNPARDMEVRDTLTQGLEKLTAGQRDVLFLHAVEGFTGEEIARILGIRPKTVWTRLHRARQRMLEELSLSDASQPAFCEGEA
jgi:RNA polymerase sigma-70 factor, ECF subfamily